MNSNLLSSKEIIEGNRLIAEFAKLKKLKENTWINPVLATSTDHLAYHESWGWLAPVLEKICRLKIGDGIKTVDYAYPRTFGMLNENGEIMVRLNGFAVYSANTLIEATWLAVVEFIQWYNQQSPSNS